MKLSSIVLTRFCPLLLLTLGLLPGENLRAQAAIPQTREPDIIVSQGGADIRFVDVDARLARVPARDRAGFMNDPQRIESLLNGQLLIRQLAARARAEGIDADPVLKAELELVQDELLAKRMVSHLMSQVDIPQFETAARERYATHPESYRTPESISVRHLLILRDVHGEEGAKARAEELAREARKPGADFEALVKAHSEEKNAAVTGGLIPAILPGRTVGEFEKAAFALKEPGDLSEAVASRYGYHVIQLVSRTPSVRRSFDQVKEEILVEMRRDYLARARQSIIDEIRARPLQPSGDNILALRFRYLPDGEGTRALAASPGANHATGDASSAVTQGADEPAAGAGDEPPLP